jgi:hypothetical protein
VSSHFHGKIDVPAEAKLSVFAELYPFSNSMGLRLKTVKETKGAVILI